MKKDFLKTAGAKKLLKKLAFLTSVSSCSIFKNKKVIKTIILVQIHGEAYTNTQRDFLVSKFHFSKLYGNIMHDKIKHARK